MNTFNYEHQQIDRVTADGPDLDSGGVYRMQIWGAGTGTKTLSVTPDQLARIRAVFDENTEPAVTVKPWVTAHVDGMPGS